MPSASIASKYEVRIDSISFINCFVSCTSSNLLGQNTLPFHKPWSLSHTHTSMYALGEGKLSSSSQQAVVKNQDQVKMILDDCLTSRAVVGLQFHRDPVVPVGLLILFFQ